MQNEINVGNTLDVGNVFSQARNFEASEEQMSPVAEQKPAENPMQFIDRKLKEKGVPEEQVDKWKGQYFQTEAEKTSYETSDLRSQMFGANRLMRLYLGKMEENTRAIRCAVIDGLAYEEWQELITDHVVPVLSQHITTGKYSLLNPEFIREESEEEKESGDEAVVSVDTGVETA